MTMEAGRLAAHVGRLLAARNLTIALAESATGGLISTWLTRTKGSSSYFLGSVVAYDNEAKVNLLGVRRETLVAHGAVSKETAIEMADGARRVFGADLGLSDTGIAGPGGGTVEKPVGLFFLALATGSDFRVAEHRFTGGRLANRQQAACTALLLVQDYLLGFGESEWKNGT